MLLRSDEKKHAQKVCSLEAVFYAVKSIHETPIEYGFTVNAKQKIKEYDSEYQDVAGKYFYNDSFVRYALQFRNFKKNEFRVDIISPDNNI